MRLRAWVLVLMAAAVLPPATIHAEPGHAPIPETAIERLRQQARDAEQIESTIERRGLLKRIVRRSLTLLDDHGGAPNRFQLLGLVFQVQKELLILKNDARNREALLATCRMLIEAPYEYAAERLEADALLMQLGFDSDGSTEYEQAIAVAELAERYRGTPAEVDSLMIASQLAFYLGQGKLLRAFRGTLSSRFREDTKAVEFLKDRFASKSSSLIFRGRFKRLDGETIVLPMDRAGHVYMAVFWSTGLNDLEDRLLPVKALQAKYPGQFEVFSFNLDELPDAGKSVLNSLDVDWHVMHLPGGREHPLFAACGSDPQFLIRIVNAHGYVILTPIDPNPNRFGRRFGVEEYLNITLDKAPFLAMLQSLRTGESLVAGDVRKTADAGIIALLKQWNTSGEPSFLRDAVAAADTALNAGLSPEAQVVPRFCLARNALRQPEAEPETVLSDFMQATGESARSIAAASLLCLDAGAPASFSEYREKLLDDHMDVPQLWPLTAYYFNKFMVGRMFRGNYYGSHVRIYHGFRGWQMDTELRPRKFLMKLNGLDGKPVAFPHPDKDKTNAIIFMEPPADQKSAEIQIDFMKRLEALSAIHFHSNLNYVAAFLSDNTNAVRAIARRNTWPADRIAMVPGGLRNPHVVRLGIFLASERPNTFTVAPDGTITWSMTGMYQMAAGANGVVGTVKAKVWEHDVRVGQAALDAGDFEKALRIFGGSFPPERFTPGHIKTAHRRGRAMAHKGLGNWDASLKEFDAIVADHTAAAVKSPCACRSLARKLTTRADMQDKRGKTTEAKADRKRATHLQCPREGDIKFHADRHEQELYNRLAGFIYRKDWDAGFEYIDGVIANGRDGRQGERVAFASTLRERAEALARRGEPERAEQDSTWADALTAGIEVSTDAGDQPRRSRSYVDVVEESAR